jgi:hypothetical protein
MIEKVMKQFDGRHGRKRKCNHYHYGPFRVGAHYLTTIPALSTAFNGK